MARRRSSRTRRLAVAFGVLTATGAAAAEFEQPPSFSPSAMFGAASKGGNYEIQGPVASDGLLRHYTVATSFGAFDVAGDALMTVRLRELAAVQELDQINVGSKFGQEAVKTALSPVIFAGSLIVNPMGTTQRTIGGVGQFFGSVGADFHNFGKSRDDTVASMTGEAREKRDLAEALGVDPYTDFTPLAAKLDQVAGAGAAGSLLASGAIAVTPGIAGMVVSNVSTASSLGETIADHSSAQLMDISRDRLLRLGVDRATADRLFANPYFTPLDAVVISAALQSLAGAEALSDMVAAAAGAGDRATAYFIRRRIELTAAWARKRGAIVGFANADDPRFPVGRTADGLVGVYPIDALSWTPETERVLQGMTAAGSGPKTLAISGTATRLARTRVKALGWTLEERAKP